MTTDSFGDPKQWTQELSDLVRGASGGFLFGTPLLYTMEVWWIGSFTTPPRMLGSLLVTFCIVFLLNKTTGFRQSKDVRTSDAVRDSIETLAIGLLCAAGVLFLINEISAETPLDEAVGKIVFESVPFSLGVALASQFLSGSRSDDPHADATNQQHSRLNATVADIGATFIGATIIAFNIAPTDEIPMLAAAVSAPRLLVIMIASLIISYGIVFEAGFADQQKREQQQGLFQEPFSETVVSYLMSLVAAASMLWFFQQLSLNDPWQIWFSYTVLLGLPATIGGAAGRLAV
jgi:putative integral membrane protein (TIGR02587 family)